jgi:hypothetical protein
MMIEVELRSTRGYLFDYLPGRMGHSGRELGTMRCFNALLESCTAALFVCVRQGLIKRWASGERTKGR